MSNKDNETTKLTIRTSDESCDESEGVCSYEIMNESLGKSVYCTFETVCNKSDIEFEYEPDGPATYVPYGETNVLYDNGRGSLIKVDATDAVEAEFVGLTTDDDKKISKELACKTLGCELSMLEKAISICESKALDAMSAAAEKHYMEHQNEVE